MSSIVSSTTSIRNTPTQLSYDSETVDQNNTNTNNVISNTTNHRNNSSNDRQHSTTSVEAINGTTSVVTTKISTDDTLSSSPSSSSYTSNNYTNSNNTNVQVSTNISGIRSNNDNNNSKKTIVIQTPKKEQEKETVSPTQVKWGNEQIIKDDNLTKENTNSNNNNNDNNNNNNNNIDEKSDTIEPDFDYKFDSQKIVTLSTDKLIQMLTALLEKIINSNDRLNHNNGSSLDLINDNDPETNSLINSIISFKGKHVPQIGLEQYFHRIQKYCPTTNDVFLSLLIYFDRISKKCNSKLQDAITTNEQQEETSDHEQNHLDNNNSLVETEDKELLCNGEKRIEDHVPTTTNETDDNQQQTFVMDSYNIHRLIIAGITVSTKFFSDFFYSNSRYARVGGISLKEMNHLELQFLVLCDFEMLISVEEMERYANLLYRFWDSDNNNNASSKTD